MATVDWEDDQEEYPYSVPEYEAFANANLIAAAPELLTVLKEAEVASRKKFPVKKATWLKMCAIIAKAEGNGA